MCFVVKRIPLFVEILFVFVSTVIISILFVSSAHAHSLEQRDAVLQQEASAHQARIKRQQSVPDQPSPRFNDWAVGPELEARPHYVADENPCFVIRKVHLDGRHADKFATSLADIIDGKDSAYGLESPIGRCLGAQSVQALAVRLQDLFIEQGYVTTRVLVTPQDISSGNLTLTVLPGIVSAIRRSDTSDIRAHFWNAVPITEGAILNLRDLEQGLENLRRLPTAQADSRTHIQAGNALTLGTVTTGYVSDTEFDSRNRDNRSVSTEVGTEINTKGEIALQAKDMTLRNANVQSDKGQVTAVAERNLTIEAGRAEEHSLRDSYYKRRGFWKTVTNTAHVERHDEHTLASEIGGRDVRLQAGNDIRMTASNVVGDQNVHISAGNNLIVAPEITRHSRKEEYTIRKSGVLTGGGFGITFGSQRRSDAYDERHNLQSESRSTIGSLEGDVALTAGKQLAVNGTDLVAAGNMMLSGGKVDIDADTDHRYSKETHRFSQSGVTISVESPVIDAVQAMSQIGKNASQTKSSRMKALAILNDAMAVGDTVSSLQDTAASMQAAAAGEKGGSAGAVLSIMVGGSSSKSERVVEQQTHHGSLLQAGKDIRIQASGADDSDVHIKGSNVSAGGDIHISAERDIVLGSTIDTESIRGRNQSSSGAVGVAIGYENGSAAFGIRLSGSIGRGKENGDAQIHNNTRLNAQRKITLESGKNTTLQGATVTAPHIRANVGGNLVMESPQDTETYKSDQKSAGGSVTIGYGASGSAQVGMQKIKSDFASVGEQTGLIAGDQGFDIAVGGHTALTGAVISSTENAVKAGVNRFSTGSLSVQDVNNHAEYSATSIGVGGGYSPGASSPFSGGAGIGNKSGSASSVSRAGISGIAGHTDIRTGDKQSGLQKIFDADDVQKEVAAQVAITKEFGARASKAIGDYADSRLMQAAALQRQALKTTDPVQRDRLLAQAASITDTWGEGGTGRVLAHGIVGGLTGNVAGAAGAVASQLSAPAIHKALSRADIPQDLREALVAVGSNVVGAAAGGAAGQGGVAAGVATAHNATLNNYLKHDEVKRFARQLKECSGNAQCQQQVLAEAAAVSAINDGALRDCKSSGSCEQLIAEYRKGEAAFVEQINTATADSALLEKLMLNQPLASAIIRGKLYDKVDTSPEGLARAQRLEGYAKAVAGMTAAGAAVESVQGVVQVVDALERGQLDQLAAQYLRGLKDLPQAVKAKLGSGDAAQIAEGVATALKTVHPKNLISGLKSVTREPHALKKIEKLSEDLKTTSTAGAFINTSKVTKYSLLDGKLNAAERNWARQIANGFDKKGELSEKLVNSVARRQGYKLLDGKYGGNKGFDHVLVGKDGVVIIVETKQFSSKGAIQLGRSGAGKKVVQLENDWVNNVLQNLPQESPARIAVERANLSGKLKRVIAGFNRETGNLHFIPVKPNTK